MARIKKYIRGAALLAAIAACAGLFCAFPSRAAEDGNAETIAQPSLTLPVNQDTPEK